ncbi:hypothetical protein ACOMHN_008793 [Nucella lapillus]
MADLPSQQTPAAEGTAQQTPNPPDPAPENSTRDSSVDIPLVFVDPPSGAEAQDARTGFWADLIPGSSSDYDGAGAVFGMGLQSASDSDGARPFLAVHPSGRPQPRTSTPHSFCPTPSSSGDYPNVETSRDLDISLTTNTNTEDDGVCEEREPRTSGGDRDGARSDGEDRGGAERGGNKGCEAVCRRCRELVLLCCCGMDPREARDSPTPSEKEEEQQQQQGSDNANPLSSHPPPQPSAAVSSLQASHPAPIPPVIPAAGSDDAGVAAYVDFHLQGSSDSSYDNVPKPRRTGNPGESHEPTRPATAASQGAHAADTSSALSQDLREEFEKAFPPCRRDRHLKSTGRTKKSPQKRERRASHHLAQFADDSSPSEPLERRNTDPLPRRLRKKSKSPDHPERRHKSPRAGEPGKRKRSLPPGPPEHPLSPDPRPWVSGPGSPPYRPELLRSGRNGAWTDEELEAAGVNEIRHDPLPPPPQRTYCFFQEDY